MKKGKPSVKHPHTENKDNFKFTWLGQTVLKYQVPWDIFNALNGIYEERFVNLPNASKQLVGKIEDQHSLYFNGPKNDKMHCHNFLPPYILEYFKSRARHYLDFNKIIAFTLHINSVWVNETRIHEYNPVHIHQGTLYTVLSSVMFLKLCDMGPEISRADQPMNGQLQIMGSSSGQFVKSDYSPDAEERDFYLFPYDMRHCVYPHNNPNGVRRTLVVNMDIDYDPVKSRTAAG